MAFDGGKPMQRNSLGYLQKKIRVRRNSMQAS